MADINGGLGQKRCGRGWATLPNTCIGDKCAARERHNGTAYRGFVERNHLRVLNTHRSAGPTFFGPKDTATRIDYLASPAGVHCDRLKNIMSASERRLQLINIRFARDHYPLFCRLECHLQHQRLTEERPDTQWDHDHLGLCMMGGTHREEYIDKLEATFEEGGFVREDKGQLDLA